MGKIISLDHIAGGDGVSDGNPTLLLPHATQGQKIPKGCDVDHSSLYFNRELSWLDFNWRVLYQALDERVPLFERVRFLSIASSNLDEFFRKRVGGLKRQLAAGVMGLSPDGRTPEEQLRLIARTVPEMYKVLGTTWELTLKSKLRNVGVFVHDYKELDGSQKKAARAYFRDQIFPILTPLAVDPGHPFPFISNLSLSLAVMLRNPKRDTEHFARIKVPTSRPRFVPLGDSNHFVPLEQVVREHVDELFKGMEILGAYVFRITRNADIHRDEEEADDLIEMISDELKERRSAPVVRLEVERGMPGHVRLLLQKELQLEPWDVYESANGMLDHTGCSALANLPVPDQTYEPWEPVAPSRLRMDPETQEMPNIFSEIKKGDILVHHPYESFRLSTQHFLESAVEDPNVLAIKQTLYRTSNESPIIKAHLRGAEKGKQVAVLVEVKARFDEQNNIEWGQMLEKSGVHVTYGLIGLKTHTKVTLVVREEEDGLRTYCHIGTGNYNPSTARLYTDIGIFTCDEEVGTDIVNLFHYLTGYAAEQSYKTLLVAPQNMRERFVELIQKEIENSKAGKKGHIIAQMNALDDVNMIQELYRASREGVKIDLIVRGHCRLRPGLKGFSENISVISIVGRFLEHTRIYYFENDGSPRIFMGSADWQRRNLEDRVEVITEIQPQHLKERLATSLLSAVNDHRQAWELNSEGRYILRMPGTEEEAEGFHDLLMHEARNGWFGTQNIEI